MSKIKSTWLEDRIISRYPSPMTLKWPYLRYIYIYPYLNLPYIIHLCNIFWASFSQNGMRYGGRHVKCWCDVLVTLQSLDVFSCDSSVFSWPSKPEVTHPDAHSAATITTANPRLRRWLQTVRSMIGVEKSSQQNNVEVQNFKQHYQIFKVTQKWKTCHGIQKKNNVLLQNPDLKFIEGTDLETHAWLGD